MDVKLGTGNATGMFYTAPAGTAIPAKPTDTIPEAWVNAGNVTADGIDLALSKSNTNLKNWANKIIRSLLTDHDETIKVPLMDTTEASLKVVVGAKNVTKSAGVITVKLSDSDLPEPRAFLWVMKDGDTMMMIGCSQGQVTAVDNVGFKPGDAITWTATVTAQGNEGMVLRMEDGTTPPEPEPSNE